MRDVDQFNIAWDTPSLDSRGSMPLGNGDIALNVWAERDGDLVLYLSKSDAWSEIGHLLKVGRIRIKLSTGPFDLARRFRQTLWLERGEVEIATPVSRFRIWVDARHPVVEVEITGTSPLAVEAQLELWRTEHRELSDVELHGAYGLGVGLASQAPYRPAREADTILSSGPYAVVWCHRNATSIWAESAALQGLRADLKRFPDALRNRTFGGAMTGPTMKAIGNTTLKSKHLATTHRLSIYLLTTQTASVEEWHDQLRRTIASVNELDVDARRAAHQAW